MRAIILLAFTTLTLFSGCFAGSAQKTIPTKNTTKIVTGAERLEAYIHLLKGKRVGCVVHHASRVGQRHLVDTLMALGFR